MILRAFALMALLPAIRVGFVPTGQGSTAVRRDANSTSKKLLRLAWPHDVASATATVSSRKVTVNGTFLQVFTSKLTKREVFRVELGDARSMWWHYGIAAEGDFNGDGAPDYYWYGGDDTSDIMYVFLSHEGEYRRLDVYESLLGEWRRRFPARVPLDISADNDQVDRLYLVREPSGLALDGMIVRDSLTTRPRRYPIHVAEGDFVFSNDRESAKGVKVK